jgi:hypothetical protein
MRITIFFILLFAASIAHATSYFPEQMFESSENMKQDTENLAHHQSTVQEGTPAIPKTWKLVSVACGDKPGAFALWFQADNGSVYVKQGELLHDRLVLHDLVIKIPSK